MPTRVTSRVRGFALQQFSYKIPSEPTKPGCCPVKVYEKERNCSCIGNTARPHIGQNALLSSRATDSAISARIPLTPLCTSRLLTICSRSLISDGRVATLVDLVLRTGTTTCTSLPVPDTIRGMVFDLTSRYSSPGCLLLFLNVPHNMLHSIVPIKPASTTSDPRWCRPSETKSLPRAMPCGFAKFASTCRVSLLAK